MTDTTLEDFSRLVAGIYAAAVTPDRWEQALDGIRRTQGGTICTLIHSTGGAWSIEATTAAAEISSAYADHYHRLDYVLAAVENGPPGMVRTGAELIAPQTNAEFYHDWMRPNGIEDGLFIGFTVRQRLSCLLVASPRRTEAFDTAERVRVVSKLVPHVQQALRTQGQLSGYLQNSVDLAAALEVVRHGIIIVGPDWCVVNLNQAAEQVLRAEDGLRMWSGRVVATSRRAEQTLQCALQTALHDGGSAVRGGGSFVCERPSGKRAYVVQVLPLQDAEGDENRSKAKALLVILDPEKDPEPSTSLLRRLYGLTAAEADIAVRIARGAELKQIADESSVSITTVRKHLQHLYDKTDTHRQAELVRLLLMLQP